MGYKNKEKLRAYQKKYHSLNKERIAELARIRYAKNPDAGRVRSMKWIEANREKKRAASRRWNEKNKVRVAARQKEWRRSNRGRINSYEKKRMATDPSWKIRKRLSGRLNEVIKVFKGKRKAAKTMELIGCTRQELMGWLESKFKPGMSWGNYGVHGWHIDHKKPCASFDLSDPEQQKQCFHYTNLQALWAAENISKSDKLEVA